MGDSSSDGLESFFSSLEYKVGEKKLAELKTLRDTSCTLFTDEKTTAMSDEIVLYKASLTGKLAALEEQIVHLASSRLSVSRLIDMASDVSLTLDMARLLTLYFQNDVNQYREETNLDDSEIQTLHRLLIEFVETKTAEQQALRSFELLTTLTRSTKDDEKNSLKLQIAQTMLAKNTLDAAKDTELSAFQIHSNMLLRQNQVSALEKLLTQREDKGFSESIEKVIMGGGKSKVILPTLAQKKADGNNLVIVEVPRALLQTCYADLRGTSRALFNQEAFIFDFNRSSDCSPEALKRLHSRFLLAIRSKSYMVTTGESLQSLELKYFELLKTPPGKFPGWREAVHTLDQLISLLRERGELIIDEAHDGLLVKNKLNYTLGEHAYVSFDIAHASVSFYQFIDAETFTLSGIEDPVSLSDILQGKHTLTPLQYHEMSEHIIDLMLTRDNSPIKSIIDGYAAKNPGKLEAFHITLKHYLLNQSTEVPSFVSEATPAEREILALYKAELSQTLSSTLSRKYQVNYGESPDTSLAVEERAIAIPYRANKVPKYGSSFGNEIEAMNYTIQSMLLSGIGHELFIKLLLQWREAARNESLIYRKDEDLTSTGALFKRLSEESFSDVDVYNTATQDRLYNKLKYNKGVIFSALETLVLNKIKIDKQVLHSDAYSHVDLVHSCQGITGTPWNSTTFHQRLSYNDNIALGTDGYVVSAIKEKAPALIGLDFDNATDFVTKLLERSSGRTRAIIDVSATFKGVENHSVATELACYIDAHQTKFSTEREKIKYILYFNEADQLSAMPVTAEERKKGPIVIGSSDPKMIQQKLRSSPEELFTYYDQSHTVGADIKQEDDAKAIVLADQTTQLQSFLQGAMRMRGLVERAQSIDIVMPVKMEKTFHDSATEPFVQFINLMRANEKDQLKIDNFHAAISKIYNAVRNDFCLRIVAIDTNMPEMKSKAFNHFESFFIELQEMDLFSKFGDVTHKKKTSEILRDVSERTLKQWEALLTKAAYTLSDDERTLMKAKFESIIRTMGECSEEQLYSTKGLDVAAETMKQQENEQEVQVEVMLQTLNKSAAAHKTCNKYHPMSLGGDFHLDSLNKACKTSFFDETLRVSNNFSQGYIEQKEMLDGDVKPVHSLYFTRKKGKLYCQLLTQQECKELLKTVAADKTGESWICTTSNTLLAGTPAEGIKRDAQYQRLLTQARYFNGEFDKIIADKDIEYDWLKEGALKKMRFFEQHLFSQREITTNDMMLAKRVFSSYSQGVEHVIANPYITATKLSELLPSFSGRDIDAIKAAAARFTELLDSWGKTSFSNDCKRAKLDFGIYSSDFEPHIDNLILLKGRSALLNRQGDTIPLLQVKQDIPVFSAISIHLLKTLLRKSNKPLTDPDNYFLLYAMAINPDLSHPELKTVMETGLTNVAIRYALLLNNRPTIKMTTENLDEILLSDKHTLVTLSTMASHPMLRDAQISRLLSCAANLSITPTDRNNIKCRLIINREVSVIAILDIIRSEQKLNTAGINAILSRNDISEPKIFHELLANGTKTSAKQATELLGKLAAFANDEKYLRFIVEHQACNDEFLLQVMANAHCTPAIVEQLLTRNKLNGDHLAAALNNKTLTFELKTLRLIAATLIEKTNASRFSSDDKVVPAAVIEMQKQLEKTDSFVGSEAAKSYRFKALCESFKTTYQMANSPAMHYLRDKISALRGLMVFGGTNKANAIEKAVAALSLKDRLTVIVDDRNPLSVALARHRHWFASAKPPKYVFTDYGRLFVREKAARTYKEFDALNKNLQSDPTITNFKTKSHTVTNKTPAVPIIVRMTEYKAALERRKGNHWHEKSDALDYAIKALNEGTPIDVVTFETLFPNYAKGTFSSKVNHLINEAIEQSKSSTPKPP